MLDKAMGQALGGVSESYLESAMGVYDRKRKERRRWRKVTAAAVAVVILFGALVFWPEGGDPSQPGIIAVPGVMKVYACELEGMSTVEIADYALIEGADLSEVVTWAPFFGSAAHTRGIPLSFTVEDESLKNHELTLEIRAYYGELHGSLNEGYLPLEKNVTLQNGDTIYWTGNEIWDATTDLQNGFEETLAQLGGVYIDIIIQADGHIVGCAIIEIGCLETVPSVLSAGLLASVYYPKVNGEFQDITEEYITEQIALIKAK